MPRTKQTAYNPALRSAPKILPPATGLDGSIKDEPRTDDVKKPWTTCVAWWENGRPYLVRFTFPNRREFSYAWWAYTSRASGEAFQMLCQWLVLAHIKYCPEGPWGFGFVFNKKGLDQHSFAWSELNRSGASDEWKNWGDVWTCITNHLAEGEEVEAEVILMDEMVLLGDRGVRALGRASKRGRGLEPEAAVGAAQVGPEESDAKRRKVE